MAFTVWPATLPQSPARGARQSGPANMIRSGNKSGLAKMRRRFTAVPEFWSLVWMMNKAQVETLTDWFEDTLEVVNTFDMLHPRTGLTVEFRFRGRFQETQLDDDAYRIEGEVEIVPPANPIP